MDRRIYLRHLIGVCDAAVLAASFAASFWICELLFGRQFASFANYIWLLWAIVPLWLVALRAFGLYDSASYQSLWDIAGRMIKAQMLAALMLLSTMYLTKSGQISRLLLQTFFGMSFVALTIQKLAVRRTLEYLRRRQGVHVRKVLVVCDESHANAYSRVLEEHASWHSDIVGFLMPEAGERTGLLHAEQPVLGGPMDLPRVLLKHVVDEVVVVQPFGPTETERISEWCTERGITLRIMIELPNSQTSTYRAHDLGKGLYLLSIDAVSQDALQLFFKRTLDVAGALVGLIVCIPVYLWYRGKLSREAEASPLFAQTRVGQNGRRFTLYKLRTMHNDAERRLRELLGNNQMRGHMFKLKEDPRITPTGKQLRERHLDELPQFWNVLKGEMSLVGTRPPTALEVKQYDPHHHRRLSMKPGVTGLWQVRGNGEINDFEEVVKLDCEYIDNWSLWLDLKIIAKTVVKVAAGSGW
jgi:exopolysaccharide biosynthesis polyprenyl glycosylphosphotransferase